MVNDAGLSRWAQIGFDEVAALFDGAHKGLPQFVQAQLHPWEAHLLRSVDLEQAANDLLEVVLHRRQQRRPAHQALILPSERGLSTSFERHCLGPMALDAYFERTFGFVEQALVTRHGQEAAHKIMVEARLDFGPVRQEALRRLTVGPALLRPFLSPARYATAPALWALVWLASTGARRRAAVRTVLREVAPALAQGDRIQRGLGALAGRWALMGGLCVLGASVASTASCHVLDVAAMYADMLDGVEAIVLYGSEGDDPEHDTHYGLGLVDVLTQLDEAKPSTV